MTTNNISQFQLEHKTLKLADLLRKSPDEIPMLVENLLPKVGLAGLIGESDIGKSAFLMQLCLHITLGHKSFLEFNLNTEHKRALYISTEDDILNLGPRLRKTMKGLEVNLSDIDDIEFNISNPLSAVPSIISSFLQKNRYDLVVIDAFSDLLEKDGNSNAEVRKILQPLSNLASKFECLIFILHHIRKTPSRGGTNKNDSLGSSAFEAKMRTLLLLERGHVEETVFLKVAKGNYLPDKVKQNSVPLTFKNLVFSSYGDSSPSSLLVADIKDNDEQILIKAIDEAGHDSTKFAIYQVAKQNGYNRGKSTFYKQVDPLIKKIRIMNLANEDRDIQIEADKQAMALSNDNNHISAAEIEHAYRITKPSSPINEQEE